MNQSLIPAERIINKIYFVRSKKVMFDFDLAELYEVDTKYLKRQVRRNIKRFPDDFMFQLNKQELKNWRRHFVTSNSSFKMGLRYAPYVFTEQGVAMLSSILKSGKAVQVNIQIIRTFVKLREILLTNKELKQKVEQIEKKYDKNFAIVFEVIKKLIDKKVKPVAEIGFKNGKK